MAKIARRKLAGVLADKADARGVGVQALSHEIAAYLLGTHRVHELDSLLRDVMEIRAARGTVEVVAVSAHPLTARVRADIEAEIRKRLPTTTPISTVIVSQRLDPTVVGGVRLELANQQLDLSVRAKLNRFKQMTSAHGI